MRHPSALAIGLCAIAAAYIAISLATIAIPPPTEQTFDRTAGAPVGTLQVYLEILSFDPVRDALEARLDFATASSPLGSRFAGVAGRDMVVEIAQTASRTGKFRCATASRWRRSPRRSTSAAGRSMLFIRLDHYGGRIVNRRL